MVLDLVELRIGILRDCCTRRIVDSAISQYGKIVSVKEFWVTCRLLYVVLTAIIHLNLLVALSAFGLHQHHTVGRTCTINGCGCGVFQNGYALNIVGVKVRKAHLAVGSSRTEAWNAIDNQQWGVVDTTHTNVGFARRAGVASGLHHLQTSDLTC